MENMIASIKKIVIDTTVILLLAGHRINLFFKYLNPLMIKRIIKTSTASSIPIKALLDPDRKTRIRKSKKVIKNINLRYNFL